MERRLGTVRISPQVLATIARLTTLSVPGVLGMYRDISSGVDRWFRGKGAQDGVRVEVIDDAVSVDLSIIVSQDANVLEVGRKIQAQVSRAITDMVGMPVLAVNVSVQDVRELPVASGTEGD